METENEMETTTTENKGKKQNQQNIAHRTQIHTKKRERKKAKRREAHATDEIAHWIQMARGTVCLTFSNNWIQTQSKRKRMKTSNQSARDEKHASTTKYAQNETRSTEMKRRSLTGSRWRAAPSA